MQAMEPISKFENLMYNKMCRHKINVDYVQSKGPIHPQSEKKSKQKVKYILKSRIRHSLWLYIYSWLLDDIEPVFSVSSGHPVLLASHTAPTASICQLQFSAFKCFPIFKIFLPMFQYAIIITMSQTVSFGIDLIWTQPVIYLVHNSGVIKT